MPIRINEIIGQNESDSLVNRPAFPVKFRNVKDFIRFSDTPTNQPLDPNVGCRPVVSYKYIWVVNFLK